MVYNIKICNYGNCIIYNEDIEAENENAAMMKVLAEVPLSSGDTIFFDEDEI